MTQEQEQLLRMVKRGKLSKAKLEELLQTTNKQIARYDHALAMLNRSGVETASFDTYESIVQASTGGGSPDITQQKWDVMPPSEKQDCWHYLSTTLHEVHAEFSTIKVALEAALETQSIGGKKAWWQFWK